MKKLTVLVLTLFATLGLAFAAPASHAAASGPRPVPYAQPAHATTWYKMQHVSVSGPCVDLPNGNTANGVQFQIWTCNGRLPNQGFLLISTSWQQGCTTACASIENADGKCVDLANGGSDGGKIQDWTCLNDEDQAWMPVSVNGGNSWPVYYANPHGYCIDLTNDNEHVGTLIQAWGCPLDRAEEWTGP